MDGIRVEAPAVETDRAVLEQARAAADRAVEAESDSLKAAFDSGNVTEIEKALYRVFSNIYLQGYADGQS